MVRQDKFDANFFAAFIKGINVPKRASGKAVSRRGIWIVYLIFYGVRVLAV